MTNITMLVRDRLRLTEQALATLRANTPHEEYNLCIVDDGSQDFRVRRLLEAHAGRANTTRVRLENSRHVLARGKNLGAYWSEQSFGRGEWLYFSDSDVAFTPGWLEILTKSAADTEFAGFKLWGGQIHPFHQTVHAWIREWEPKCEVREAQVLDGPSWLMRWSTWDQTGPFSRECAPGTCQSEDAEWCARLVVQGGRIGVTSPHTVLHCGITQTDGKLAPGHEIRLAQKVPGYLYE